MNWQAIGSVLGYVISGIIALASFTSEVRVVAHAKH